MSEWFADKPSCPVCGIPHGACSPPPPSDPEGRWVVLLPGVRTVHILGVPDAVTTVYPTGTRLNDRQAHDCERLGGTVAPYEAEPVPMEVDGMAVTDRHGHPQTAPAGG